MEELFGFIAEDEQWFKPEGRCLPVRVPAKAKRSIIAAEAAR